LVDFSKPALKRLVNSANIACAFSAASVCEATVAISIGSSITGAGSIDSTGASMGSLSVAGDVTASITSATWAPEGTACSAATASAATVSAIAS